MNEPTNLLTEIWMYIKTNRHPNILMDVQTYPPSIHLCNKPNPMSTPDMYARGFLLNLAFLDLNVLEIMLENLQTILGIN